MNYLNLLSALSCWSIVPVFREMTILKKRRGGSSLILAEGEHGFVPDEGEDAYHDDHYHEENPPLGCPKIEIQIADKL
jgi:hypothetical protein